MPPRAYDTTPRAYRLPVMIDCSIIRPSQWLLIFVNTLRTMTKMDNEITRLLFRHELLCFMLYVHYLYYFEAYAMLFKIRIDHGQLVEARGLPHHEMCKPIFLCSIDAFDENKRCCDEVT